jgi:hypothetical protein
MTAPDAGLPGRQFAVEFRLWGVHSLPAHKARELAEAFGRALDRRVSGVRVVRTLYGRNRLACEVVAPHAGLVLEAARRANLAPDFVHEQGEAEAGEATRSAA